MLLACPSSASTQHKPKNTHKSSLLTSQKRRSIYMHVDNNPTWPTSPAVWRAGPSFLLDPSWSCEGLQPSLTMLMNADPALLPHPATRGGCHTKIIDVKTKVFSFCNSGWDIYHLHYIYGNTPSLVRLSIMLSSNMLLLRCLIEKKILEFIFNINRKQSQIFLS